MKVGWALTFGLVGGLLGAALLALVLRQPAGQPVRLNPPPTQSAIQVHVAGAVTSPGLYSVAHGSRVDEAIRAAGGLLPDASTETINLAALLVDGERIYIPTRVEMGQAAPESVGGNLIETPDGSAIQIPGNNRTGTLPININTATVPELESLPGIGPTLAKRIVDYRTANGLFPAIEDIMKVNGIGSAIFEQIKDQITIGYTP